MSPMFLSRALQEYGACIAYSGGPAHCSIRTTFALQSHQTRPQLTHWGKNKLDWDDICNKWQALSLLENQIEKLIDVMKQLD